MTEDEKARLMVVYRQKLDEAEKAFKDTYKTGDSTGTSTYQASLRIGEIVTEAQGLGLDIRIEPHPAFKKPEDRRPWDKEFLRAKFERGFQGTYEEFVKKIA